MENYLELTIKADEATQEMLIAGLSELGFDGFEESADQLKAYVPESGFQEKDFNNLLNTYQLNYSKSIIQKQNWNKVWESNFEPVLIDDFVGIRADFHPAFEQVAHDLVITPKMSFGTGHHATTHMVIQLMRSIDFEKKSVFDFGTGTGILAILAEKLGASSVLATDNDDWCIENAMENVSVNHCQHIRVQKSEVLALDSRFHIILANINRNIILENLERLKNGMAPGGSLILSGLLKADADDILAATQKLGLELVHSLERNGWIGLQFCEKKQDN
jgi:ribosomal protein L11 methyltransferase